MLIERSVSNKSEFRPTFEDDRNAVVQNPDALMFPSYILGWHEIEQAATDPNIFQVYLDTIAGREQIRQLQEKADTHASRVQQLHAEVDSRYTTFRALRDQVARLEDLRSGLQDLKDSNLIALRDRYQIAVRQREAIQDVKRALRASADDLANRSELFVVHAEPSALEGDSPLAPYAQNVLKEVQALKSSVTTFADKQCARFHKLAEELDAADPELERTFEEFAREYDASVAELTQTSNACSKPIDK